LAQTDPCCHGNENLNFFYRKFAITRLSCEISRKSVGKNAGRNRLRNLRLAEYRPKNTISRPNISKKFGWGVYSTGSCSAVLTASSALCRVASESLCWAQPGGAVGGGPLMDRRTDKRLNACWARHSILPILTLFKTATSKCMSNYQLGCSSAHPTSATAGLGICRDSKSEGGGSKTPPQTCCQVCYLINVLYSLENAVVSCTLFTHIWWGSAPGHHPPDPCIHTIAKPWLRHCWADHKTDKNFT